MTQVNVWETDWCTPATIVEDGGITQLINGTTRLVNDALSRQLVAQGITGDVIIHHPGISRAVSRWLLYNLGKEQPAEWLNILKVYTLGQTPTDTGIEILPLTPYKIKVRDLRAKIIDLSRDHNFDGLLVGELFEESCARWYHLLPNRFIQGKVLSFTLTNHNRIQSLICEVPYQGKTYVIKVAKAPAWSKKTTTATVMS